MVLGGCAGTAPKAKFIQAPKANVKVDTNDMASIHVVAGAGVEMLEIEERRMAQIIEQKLNARKVLNGAGGEVENYDVDVTITRYDKGNAFARAMLAGLGQIHIDATVRLFTAEEREKLSEFNIKKTFAWGGLYGGFTGIEDVEPAFAEGVAASLTGTAKSSPDK